MNAVARRLELTSRQNERSGRAPRSGARARAAGDNRDFEWVYNQGYEDVVRWVRALGGPISEQDDLIQDIFLVVYRRLPEFDGQNLHAWLYRITAHRVRDYRRLAWVRHVFGNNALAIEKLESVDPTPIVVLETSEKRRELERLLAKLSSRLRATFMLFEVDGYTAEEIADIQGVATNTVRARIQRARKKLLQWLKSTRRRKAT